MSELYDYWSHTGHRIGSCWHSEEHNIVYINIPKNASTWCKQVFQDLDFKPAQYQELDLSSKDIIVILRDPVDRWISGISQFLGIQHRNLLNTGCVDDILQIVTESVAFDDHTDEQIYFIDKVPRNRVIYFEFNNNLKYNLHNYLDSKNIINKCLEIDTANPTNEFTKNWMVHIKDYVQRYPEVIDIINNYNRRSNFLINKIRQQNLFYEH